MELRAERRLITAELRDAAELRDTAELRDAAELANWYVPH
jgi:hypothetical protein